MLDMLQAVDLLLLHMLLQPVQAQRRPNEIHCRQRHDSHQGHGHLAGGGSGCIRDLWNGGGRASSGQSDCWHHRHSHSELYLQGLCMSLLC